ncbi:MAG TPA: zinc-dependent dehydrogenase [Bacillota bacterium]|nr:zinc-dependent dehydrogenase [Bacillota bacterium]
MSYKNKMTAAVVYGRNDLRVEQVDIPEVPEGSIRIKVMSCAICGTDKRIYKAGDYRASYPVITGHEIAGVVESVAPGVTSVKVGDRVCVAPGHGCGHCAACKAGFPNVCLTPHPSLGYKLNGGFAEYMAIPRHIFELGFVNRIPDGLSFDRASLSEIVACCINAQNNVSVKKGDTVLIFGAGPAGLIHAQLSKLRGASKVIMTQRSAFRLERAKADFSDAVDYVISSEQEDLTSRVLELTDGRGADVVIVCAPSAQAQEQAVSLAAPRGRINFFGGLPKDANTVSLDANMIHYKELFISGASSSHPEGNREALKLLSEKKIDPDRLITHVFPLSQVALGYENMENKMAIKVVIHCSEHSSEE